MLRDHGIWARCGLLIIALRHGMNVPGGPIDGQACGNKLLGYNDLPEWRNWQTRWIQNPVSIRTCGFESHLWYFFIVNDLRQLVLSPTVNPISQTGDKLGTALP